MKFKMHALSIAALLSLGEPLSLTQAATSTESPIVIRAVTIPMAEAGPGGLRSWLVLPNLPGKHPLVLQILPSGDLWSKDSSDNSTSRQPRSFPTNLIRPSSFPPASRRLRKSPI